MKPGDRRRGHNGQAGVDVMTLLYLLREADPNDPCGVEVWRVWYDREPNLAQTRGITTKLCGPGTVLRGEPP